MSFYTSLSGLQASQSDMQTISHNLANVSTDGFKKSRTQFADVIASNISTDPRKMTGSGTVVKATTQQFSEGNLSNTSNSLDLAVMGDGFFTVRTNDANDAIAYTRNGAFSVDANRNVVDSQGSFLMVYPVDASGNVTATGSDGLTNLQLQQTSGTPVATQNVATAMNLSSTSTVKTGTFSRTDPSSYNNSTATTVYDATGNPMTMTSYYVRTAVPSGSTPSTWQVYTFVGDTQLKVGGSAAPTNVTFDSSGALTSPTTPIQYDGFIPSSGGTMQNLSLKLTGTTQLASAFSVNAKTQDGKSVGQLSGVTVNDSGLITASFSNGDIVPLGKVALAKFSTPTGLRQLGNSYWAPTGVSGAASLGAAGANGFGSMMSGTIEGSNVDITEELVNLIAAQRNFQANAKALDTASQISQTIFNIRN